MTHPLRGLLAAASILAALALPARAQVRPELQVTRAAGEIHVDGVLDDPGWRGAARATRFLETNPGDLVPPPVDSQVWVTYDDHNLYVAFVAQDDPAAIRASLRDRDQIWSDDFFGIMIDTYGASSWCYEIFVNPLGVQGDLRLVSGRGEDMSFDVVFDSNGRITETGYQVEVAIPFRSLRFPESPEQRWRVNFWRTHPRESRRQISWAPIDRDDPCFLCQFGTLTGIRDVHPGGRLEVLPSVTSKQVGSLRDGDDPTSGFREDNPSGDAELGLRYTFNSSTAGELTINPDFSQVEADAGQIDVNTTFALFFPERRPFFQEGSDLYDTWVDAVYTRTINDPSVASKLTGRTAHTSFGWFVARDEHSPLIVPLEERSIVAELGQSVSNVGRFRYNLENNSHFGALVTHRVQEGGGYNAVYGLDTQIRFLRNYQIEAQWMGSTTRESEDPRVAEDAEQVFFDRGKHTVAYDGERFSGNAGYLSIERHARTWQFDVDYWHTSPTFRADNGFITRNDSRRVNGRTGLDFQADNRFYDNISPSINAGRLWNFAGARKDEWVRPQIFVQLKKQTNVWWGYLYSNELFQGESFENIRRHTLGLNSNWSEMVQGGVETTWGRFVARSDLVLGEGRNVSFWGTLKPAMRLVLEPTFDFARLEDPADGRELFSGYIFRTRTSYQFTRELFLRLVVQYNDFGKAWDIDPLLTYRINPFTVFFVGSTHDIRRFEDDRGDIDYAQTERQIFLKLQYLFRM